MRKGFLLFFSCSISCFSFAATITWDGNAGDGLWATATNWVGDVVPGIADDVVFDNSIVPGSYIVTLPGGAITISVNSLLINPTLADTITLILPNTNTGDPGFSVTGPGDALVLNNGAILKNSSGAASGSGISIANTFRINNGGHYVHNTARSNVPIVNQLSAVAGTELGEFEYDVPLGSYIISLSDRTYGTLILSAVASGSITYTGTGSLPLNIKGDLQVKNQVTFSIGFSADIIIHGNLSQSPNSTINLQNSSNNNIIRILGDVSLSGTITESSTGFPVLELNGITNQNLLVLGSINNDVSLRINNPSGVTVTSSFTLPFQLQLTNGKLHTISPLGILTMAVGSSYTGGSVASFVEGPMKKVGDTDFIFPVGVGSIYAPIGIVNVSGQSVTDIFTAEYKRTDPQSIHGTAVQSGMDHVSYVEYWMLTQNTGTAVKKVSLAITPTSFCKNLNSTYVSRWDGALWTTEGSTNGGITNVPPYEIGTITSINNLSSFGDFTLITDLPFANNPLPVSLVDFSVKRISSSISAINWELVACCSAAAKFEIEKSSDARKYTLLTTVPGNETNRFYSLNDNRLAKGVTYYRLKMTDADGTIKYSKVVAVINDNRGLIITAVVPNPVHKHATAIISSAKEGLVSLVIYDLSGGLIKQWQVTVSGGTNSINLPLQELRAGIYHLTANDGEIKNVYRFVKR